ncbi:MAG: hypothetical protein KGH61_05670 [Candidatus Micrarchaeota archaeon]|nr:hypothetical protein [Candidatus Micrarchaeota archaeon]MDE1848402.1 hypothetical protein [Candidatus Micrarchaeota archaeon]
MKITNRVIEKFSAYPVFTYRDVRLSFNRSVKDANIFRALSYLKSTGRLFAIAKGRYTFNKDSAITGFAYAPFYYGLLYAMSIRELWTQNTMPEIVTLKTVRKGKAHAFGRGGSMISLHHSTPKHFFGFETIRYGKLSLPVSDPEKTLIDLFYYKTRLATQNYSGLLRAVNAAKLNRYLTEYDNHTKSAVSNFMRKYKRIAQDGGLESKY